MAVLTKGEAPIGFDALRTATAMSQGLGHRDRHAQPCRRRRHGLQGAGGKVESTSAPSRPRRSSFRILIDGAYTELAVRTLHSLYGLDKQLDWIDCLAAPAIA